MNDELPAELAELAELDDLIKELYKEDVIELKPRRRGHQTNRGKKGHSSNLGRKMSPEAYASALAAQRRPEQRERLSKAKLAEFAAEPLVICPHCYLTGGPLIMNRYHFNNCKKLKEQNGNSN